MGKLFLLMAVIATFAQAQTSEKVAVIFNGGDANDTDLRQTLDLRQQQAAALYKANGYKVIVLDSASGKNTMEGIQSTLAQLHGVSDLQMDFLAHGLTFKAGEFGHSENFSETKDTPDEARAANGPSLPPDTDSVSFAIAGGGSPGDFVGTNGLRKAIKEFQRRNPEANTTVLALSCYSGHIAEELSDLPRFQAFVSTHATSLAFTCHKAGQSGADETDFNGEITRSLCAGKDLAAAQKDALRSYFAGCKTATPESMMDFPFNTSTLSLPRNSVQGYISKWCDVAGVSPDPEPLADPELAEGVKRLSSDLLADEAGKLKSMQEQVCAPALLQDLVEINHAKKVKAWERVKSLTLTEKIPQMLAPETIDKNIEDAEKRQKSFQTMLDSKKPSDPDYPELAKDVALIQQSIDGLKKLRQQPEEGKKSLEGIVADLDECLKASDLDLNQCGSKMRMFATIVDPYSNDNYSQAMSQRMQEDSCATKIGGADRKRALGDFYDCRISTNNFGYILDSLRFISPSKTCSKLQAKITLDQNQIKCADEFSKRATPAQKSHLKKMIAMANQSFAQACPAAAGQKVPTASGPDGGAIR